MGEEFDEVVAVLKDLSQIDIDIVTIGQYLRPTSKHRPIHRYVTQDEFIEYKLIGEKFGIPHIESGPLVRSSYHADQQARKYRDGNSTDNIAWIEYNYALALNLYIKL